MNEWSSWSACPCGYHGQQKTRTRNVQNSALGHGKRCPTNNAETVACSFQPCHCTNHYYGDRCDSRHCQWGSWSSWSSCKPCPPDCYSHQCPPDSQVPKGENKSRSRSIAVQQAGNGMACTGAASQTVPCGDCVKTCKRLVPFGHPMWLMYILCTYSRG